MKLVEIGRNDWIFQDPTITDEIDDKLDRALDFWEEGHAELAEKMLCAIVAECPNHIDALHHLSLIYDEQGRVLEAYVFCQAAVSIGLQAIPMKFKWDNARVTWGLLENRPFMRAYHNLGLWHFHSDRYDEAIEIFERLLSVNPDDNQGVRYLLPVCWFEKTNYRQFSIFAPNTRMILVLKSSTPGHWHLHALGETKMRGWCWRIVSLNCRWWVRSF